MDPTNTTSIEGDLTVEEFEICSVKNSTQSHIQLFYNASGDLVYFPDKTLVALLQVNGSTLRGRLNRLTKKQAGHRLLFTERSDGLEKKATFTLALNHIDLVNCALREWVHPNQDRLGTRLAEIQENLRRAGVPYIMNGGILEIVRKPHLANLANLSAESPVDGAPVEESDEWRVSSSPEISSEEPIFLPTESFFMENMWIEDTNPANINDWNLNDWLQVA